jgi:hypothetical protein
MLSIGQLVTLAIWVIAIALALAFGGFMHKISRGEVRWNAILKDIGGILRLIANPRTLISLALIVAGVCLIASATSYHYVETTTGYRYELLQESGRAYVPELERIITVPAYTLWETPIRTTQIITMLDPFRTVLGIWLIVLGLIVGAYFSAKAVNKAYGVS